MKKYIDILAQKKQGIPAFRAGDTVRVHVKLREEEGERIQVFEGTVIRKKGSSLDETFTVRKMSFGIGVERIFHINSPNIHKIEIMKSGKVRRAKLYYLRGLTGKAASIDELRSETQKTRQEQAPAPAK